MLKEAIFHQLYQSYYKRMFFAARKVLRDDQLAEDCVQEAFVKAYKHLEKLEDLEKAGAWLATIASRTAIDMLRKNGKHTFISLELAYWEMEQHYLEHIVEKEVERKEVRSAAEEVIAKLRPKYQEVFTLKYLTGLKDSEIASVLNIPKATVKTRLHRAKAALQQAADRSLINDML